MLTMVNNAFEDKDFATNTDYDQVLHQQLAQDRMKYFNMIRNNEVDPASLQYLIQKDMSDRGVAAAKVKAMKQGVESITKDFSKESGFKPNDIFNTAMKKYLFNDKGQFRSASDMNETPDQLVGRVFTENPESVYDEKKAMDFFDKNYRSQALEWGHEEVGSRMGKTKTYKLDYKLYPYQEFVRNSKNQLEIGDDDRPKVRIKMQPTEDKYGRVVGQELDDAVYKSFAEGDLGGALVNSKFKEINNLLKQQGKPIIEDGTKEALLVKKNIVLSALKQNPLKEGVQNKDLDALKKQMYDLGLANKPGESNELTDYVIRVLKATDKEDSTPQEIADLLYEMKIGKGEYEITNAKIHNKNRGFTLYYDRKDGDSKVQESQSFNPYDKNFPTDFAAFYVKATGRDQQLKKNLLGGRVDYKKYPGDGPPKSTGKEISKEEFMKMSIPERTKFKKEGGTFK